MRHHLLKTAAVLAVSSAVALLAGPSIDAQTVKKGAAKVAPKPAAKTVGAPARALDLNTASAKELEVLPGVGAVTAGKIVAGRPYTSVDDLAKAGVPARTIDGIRGMVVVTPPPAPRTAPAAPVRKKAAAAATTAGPVDLNTATEAQLETLPGVGPAIAKGIVAGRPYQSVDDLEGKVKGIGKQRIATLRPLVTASGAAGAAATRAPASSKSAAPAATRPAAKATATAAKPVNINTASKEELESLPGIGPVKAQAIIDTRPFATPEDVMKVKGIKQGEFSKIKDLIIVK